MTLLPSNSLPSIPSLPPLEMPETSYLPMPPRRTDSSSSLRQQSASVASGESFTTAYTSPLGTPTHTESFDLPPMHSNNLSPSQNLRKSISVDSFVSYGRELPSKGGTRPNRVNTGSALDPPRGLLRNNTLPYEEHDLRTLDQTRSRGFSVSTAGDSLGDEYDFEREVEGPLKGNDQIPPSRPGQLVLPSRAGVLSSTSSMSSLTSSPSSSSPRETSHRLHATTSMQPIQRRGTSNSVSGVASARSRSGSVGITVASSTSIEKRILINTQLARADEPEISILVVGLDGCGKSTSIHKGLKAYRLSPVTACSVALDPTEPSMTLDYKRRIGRITQTENTPERSLHVFEVDSSTLNLDAPAPATSVWPPTAPKIDGVVVCYDSSNDVSFVPVEALLWRFQALSLPTIVLACKSDLGKRVDPQMAVELLRRYDVGLVEVTAAQEEGKDKMRRSFEWLLKAVVREPQSNRGDFTAQYRNPASPDFLIPSAPWEVPRSSTATPTASSKHTVSQDHATSPDSQSPPVVQIPRSPTAPTSPTRARSTGDLLSEHEKSKSRDWRLEQNTSDSRNIASLSTTGSSRRISLHEPGLATTVPIGDVEESREDRREVREKEPRPAQWATLDQLLDKLLFLAVSGDDSAYISNFLLTYRRFSSPRSVLLAMQKRIRQLDNPSGDPMFACFAQMRICALLETWIHDYPHDFAVPGAPSALNALVRTVIGKTYLLHYGCDFLPFLELLPGLIDKDASWAMKVEDVPDPNDDYKPEEDDTYTPVTEPESPASTHSSEILTNGKPVPVSPTASRERTSSLQLRGRVVPSVPVIPSGSLDAQEISPKHLIKDLVKASQELFNMDSDEIAQEITRYEVQLFLDIEPRHWLQFTLTSGKKDPQRDTIARFNEASNHIADWVVSLILCHEKPRLRARQVEKFVSIATKLRALNNYSALRAFVAGINNATFPGDPTMERFKADSNDAHKAFQSWDLLFRHIGSHTAYRMALRNTKGACIPALEVHMSDLIRAHEGNADVNSSDPTKIHWGKFNMIGKFIASTKLCQAQCRNTNDYSFPERSHINEVVFNQRLMDEEMQRSRIAPPIENEQVDDMHRTSTTSLPRSNSSSTSALLGRIMLRR